MNPGRHSVKQKIPVGKPAPWSHHPSVRGIGLRFPDQTTYYFVCK